MAPSQHDQILEKRRLQIQEEFAQRFEPACWEKDEYTRHVSQLAQSISTFRRTLSARERQRAEIQFRRPRTHQDEAQLMWLEGEIRVCVENIAALERTKAESQARIREAIAEMTGARTKQVRDLKNLSEGKF